MQKFQYTIVNLFIDSEAGLVLSMAHFSLSIKQQKQAVYNSITTTKYIKYGMCYSNGQIVYTCALKRLLTNRLHGKAAKLCLANS